MEVKDKKEKPKIILLNQPRERVKFIQDNKIRIGDYTRRCTCC